VVYLPYVLTTTPLFCSQLSFAPLNRESCKRGSQLLCLEGALHYHAFPQPVPDPYDSENTTFQLHDTLVRAHMNRLFHAHVIRE